MDPRDHDIVYPSTRDELNCTTQIPGACSLEKFVAVDINQDEDVRDPNQQHLSTDTSYGSVTAFAHNPLQSTFDEELWINTSRFEMGFEDWLWQNGVSHGPSSGTHRSQCTRKYKPLRKRPAPGNSSGEQIVCGINGCQEVYSSQRACRRHQEEKHKSAGRYSAMCLYPGCQSKFRGSKKQARRNLRTHQKNALKEGKHPRSFFGETEEQRCNGINEMKFGLVLPEIE
ncbi:hypothetical protein TWF106_006313 [Orbilia oligospora]|uniref:C2H2-type domain-containing protein n=1 Tax=Orbilia oligospora TaxID=2813651 RepID=A0A7C8UVU1_ORBOL|nr:hypothetical protein TWF106_006313 [Orbilia oligospora]